MPGRPAVAPAASAMPKVALLLYNALPLLLADPLLLLNVALPNVPLSLFNVELSNAPLLLLNAAPLNVALSNAPLLLPNIALLNVAHVALLHAPL